MKTILVCGLGRCGSSLVMQMLSAGGYPTAGTWPDFEDEATMAPNPTRADWYKINQGKAIKVLDAHLNPPPAGLDYRVIWLDRHPMEQAKSIIKFASVILHGEIRTNRAQARGIEKALKRDRLMAMNLLGGLSPALLRLDFEHVIARPSNVAAVLAVFVETVMDLNRMAAVVRKRGPDCLPYMLESQLIEEKPE